MRYAIRYYRGCRVLDKANEIIIKYDKVDSALLNFVQKWKPNQRIVLDVTELDDEDILKSIDIFKEAIKLHKQMAVMLTKDQIYTDIAMNNIPFFFFNGVYNLDELVWQTNLGVSDIYITGDLGFWLKDIYEVYHDKVNIRVVPNEVQSPSVDYSDNFKKFFIRPEDVEMYEQYVDIFEFGGSLKAQPALYDIYRDGRWMGDLSTIIIGLNESINTETIMPIFVARINCKKKCAFGKCHICDHIKIAAQEIEDKGLVITKEKRVYESEADEEFMPAESISTTAGDEGISKE